MRSLKRLLFFLCVLLAPAAPASAQDAIDLNDNALLDRVKKEIDALVLANDIARARRDALEENDASLREARYAIDAPLPDDPGEIAGLEGLDEGSLQTQVGLRERHLAIYRQRKQQLERLPGLTDDRRKMIDPAMEAFRLSERLSSQLTPLLTELARRIKSGRISQDKIVLRDNSVGFWREDVVRQQVECASWLETYGDVQQPPKSQPAAATVWDIDTDRHLQHSLDVASIMLQAAKHEVAERKDLEKDDHATFSTVIVRVHDNRRAALAEYERALDRAEIERAALAELQARRHDLTPPSKESVSEGDEHSELKTARREAAFSDQMVRYHTRRLELARQTNDVANALMQELLAIPTAFERVRRQTVTLKAALQLAEDWQREDKIASLDFPEGTNVARLAASMLTIAQDEASRRREVDELKQRINSKSPVVAAQQDLEQEQEKNTRLHNTLEEERSYAAFLQEMANKDEATLIALVEPKGTLSASIEKLAGAVDQAKREFDRAMQAMAEVRDAIRSVENPYVRKWFLMARERLTEIKAELENLKDGGLPKDRSSDPLLRATREHPAEAIGAGVDESSEGDQTLLQQAESVYESLEDRQEFTTTLWQYFVNLDEKIKRYTEALDATDKAFALTDQARSDLVNEEKRKYACARELQLRLVEGRIDHSRVPFDLSKALTREAIAQVQSDREERAWAYANGRNSRQGERDRLLAIASFGEWAKIGSDFADRKVTLITQPVKRIEAASLRIEDLAQVDRKLLEYNAQNQREADDIGWENLLASVSRVKKRKLFDESLDTFYLTVARIDYQLGDYAEASKAYLNLIELCNTERTMIVDAPEKLKEGLPPRIVSYQMARHLAAVAASPSSQLTVEDAFKKTFGSPLPIIEQPQDLTIDFWANRLFAAEARLWGHRRWIEDVRSLLSKLGLDAEIAQYEQHQAKIGSKIRGLRDLRENHRSSITAIRSDYSKAIYRAALRTLMSLLIIPMLAWVVVRVVNHFATRIEERVVDGLARDRISYHERLKTLSSVTRKTVSVVVWVIAGLYLLHELGTPVSTILASAGVLGLAFAFGAQSLIRDFFQGFFILLENQYTIGDWIEIGNISGTVERLTLRVTVLRDMEGTLHFIPNGAVASVSNMTHGWSQVKMEIGVGYDENIERVSQVILEAATKVCQSPEWKDKVLADPVVPGLQSFGDSSLNIRLVVKTQPGVQWGLARALRKRIKERFDEEGIEIPFPQRVIHHVHDDKSKTSQEKANKDDG